MPRGRFPAFFFFASIQSPEGGSNNHAFVDRRIPCARDFTVEQKILLCALAVFFNCELQKCVGEGGRQCTGYLVSQKAQN